MDDLHIGTQSVRFDAPPSILSFAAIEKGAGRAAGQLF